MATPSGSGISVPGDFETNSTAVAFVIAELTGQKRVLFMRDRALPYQGLKFQGKMKVETTYYPGNPIASQQVVGSEEGTTTVNGIWNDRFVGPGNYINAGIPPLQIYGQPGASLFQMVSTVDDMRRQGQQVQVTWGQVTRVGVITDFTATWARPVDVEWSMTFAWASQGEKQPPHAAPTPSLGDTQSQFQQAIDTVNANLANMGCINIAPITPPNPYAPPAQTLDQIYTQASNSLAAPTEFVEAVNGYTQNAYSAVNSVAQLVGQVADLVSDTVQVAQKIAALCSYSIDQFSGIEFELDSRPSVYYYNVDLPPPTPPGPVAIPVGSITPAQMMSAESSARQSRQAARNARLSAAVQRAQFLAQANPSDMVSVFVASNNQDLRRVSTEFYGSPDSWRELARYNDLPNSGLTAGQLIFVPATPPTTQASGIPQNPRAAYQGASAGNAQ